MLLLLAIGAGHDLWRALRPRARPAAAVPPHAAPATLAPGSGAQAIPPGSGAVPDTSRRAPAGPVLDLNRAGLEELDALPGIGPVLARRIVEHRRAHGPFRRVDELRAVRGVGPALLARLRGRVGVGGPPPAGP